MKHLKSLVFAGLALAASALVSAASAAELRILISGGMTAAYKELAPEFERATGHQLTAAYGPSMNDRERDPATARARRTGRCADPGR